jgi:FKBP-type peptidyl-prolyl cis-trans isomerase (trigger factor)
LKTEVKNIDKTKREISVEVSGDTVKNKFAEVFQKISKEAKVPGFRPGHAPRDILEKNYASYAREQVLKELVPEIYNQALDKEGIDAIDLPEIFDVKLDRISLSFKARLEISPPIEVKNYKGIKVDYKKIEVTADDLKRSIDALKESKKIENLDDSFAKGLGYPSVAELEQAVRMQLFLHKENQQRQKIESEIVEKIIQGLDFKVPEALISRQLQELVRQTKVDLALKGLGREKIEEQEKKITEELKPEAERQVRVYLVLAEIARKENIPSDDALPRKVMEFLLREADWG